ncbi:ankyrin repeat domain-containing protein 26-like [Erinaceus europaeus]|uniref:Ankyrin repeat domain-containing protein 26-like n=1 Tax=Erinaceus europaeus TaxID=9365 RepID=A0ABM3WNN2_ERIEU|nr:ankyrin repeat domain-containing protein 26-like [Erinaceus europaeus]
MKKNAYEDQATEKGSGMVFLQRVISVFRRYQHSSKVKEERVHSSSRMAAPQSKTDVSGFNNGLRDRMQKRRAANCERLRTVWLDTKYMGTGSPATQSNILDTNQKLQDEIATLKRDMETMKHENLMLKQDMEIMQNENLMLKRDMETMRHENLMLKEDVERMQYKNLMLKQIMDRRERRDKIGVSAIIPQTERQKTSLKEVREELLRNDAGPSATLRKILDTNQKLNSENSTLQRDIGTFQNELFILKEDINRRLRKMNATIKCMEHQPTSVREVTEELPTNDSGCCEKTRNIFQEIQEQEDEIATVKQVLDVVKHHYKMRMQMLTKKDRYIM